MPRRILPSTPVRALLASGLTLAAVAALAGCEERVGQPSPAPAPEPSQTVVEGAGSAAGKALESGHKLEDKVNEHNKQLEKQIDEIGKN